VNPASVAHQAKLKEESSSFLKKRTKKLFSVTGITRVAWLNTVSDAMSKSFLLLFFKKEESSFSFGC
jgi:hypothetical protein